MSAESRREAHRRAQGADALQGRFSRPCDAPRFVVSFTGFRQTPDGKSDTRTAKQKKSLRPAPSVYPSRVCLTRWRGAFIMRSDT